MFQTAAFDPTCVSQYLEDISSSKWVAVAEGTKLYDLLLPYVAESSAKCRSFQANEKTKGQKSSKHGDCNINSRVQLVIGLGAFEFLDAKGNRLIAVHHSKGKPVGTDYEVQLLKELVIITNGCEQELRSFLSDLIEASEVTEKGMIDIYHFSSRCRNWRSTATIKARPLDSVILPRSIKDQVISDLDNFLSDDMEAFYSKHGIPYRRSFLLYGVPGAGKTSFIQAIAGHYNRSISYLQVDPEMTDVILRASMDSLPDDTIVVIEDMDALFDRSRQSKTVKGALTFSGLLNALDGVGCATGQIYFLTTNLRDQLDPALIRKGRVDVQVMFDHAADEQISDMWASFYPAAPPHLAADFVAAVRASLAGEPVTTADLQHFFVAQMRSAAADALAHAATIAVDALQRKEEAKADAAAAAVAAGTATRDISDGSDSDDDDDGDDASLSAVAAAGATRIHHVHVHLHSAAEKARVSLVVAGPQAEDRALTPEGSQ